MHSGQDYDALRPTYAIWILDQTLFVERPEYAHRYSLRDDQGRRLVDHGVIRLFELSKFQVAQVETEAERWLKFLKDGEQLDPEHLPEWMQHPIMRQAMSILSRFSEKERDYHRYQSRQEALRVQRSIQSMLDEARAATEAARAEEQASREREQVLREREQVSREREQVLREREQAAREATDAERQAKEAALAEVARLKALLQQQTNR
ncbi:PD-(D/E)XK nuclease family transposase [Thiocapsa sp.]|uniref:PD-(D/E)XK nuclease family transposase n=1 Tax=Thiocapsa sp. TaxID=2024551 RepID=UPI001BCD5EB6|nr:PD-(D/E)XK nuclease family transposase [Thiocapsa sp.]